jgi:hypothetical protein
MEKISLLNMTMKEELDFLREQKEPEDNASLLALECNAIIEHLEER